MWSCCRCCSQGLDVPTSHWTKTNYYPANLKLKRRGKWGEPKFAVIVITMVSSGHKILFRCYLLSWYSFDSKDATLSHAPEFQGYPIKVNMRVSFLLLHFYLFWTLFNVNTQMNEIIYITYILLDSLEKNLRFVI